MNNKILNVMDNPNTKFGKYISITLLFLIYISVTQVVIEVRFPNFVEEFSLIFKFIEYFILLIFTIELFVRIIFDKKRWKYIFSFYGIVDLLAVIPGLLSFFVPILASTSWVRVFRIFRFVRLLKLMETGSTFVGIFNRILPYFAIALGFKGILVALEGQAWWPEFKLTILITVLGFALAILLGTKLRVVNSRLYEIEDALCRIIGALRDMHHNKKISEKLKDWALELEQTLTSSKKDRPEKVKNMIINTNNLEAILENENVGGPNTAGFHRDVTYLLHRATAKTPPAYEDFLKYVTFAYISVVILAIPGIVGFLSTFLLTYVMAGAYFLVDDMDNPLDYGDDSLIDVRLDVLHNYNTTV